MDMNMNMNEFKCCDENCLIIADVECTCKIKNKFCTAHYKSHRQLNGCRSEFIDDKILMNKTVLAKNALRRLKSKIIMLSSTEMRKANAVLEENYYFIALKTLRVINSIDNSKSPDYIIVFARENNIKNRDKTCFILNTRYLFSINGESEKIQNKWSEADNLQNQLKKDFELQKTKLNSLQMKIRDKDNKQYLKKLLYAVILCNLESAKFDDMNTSEKIKFLIQQEFENIKALFDDLSKINRAAKISVTNRSEFIFICKS